MWRELGLAVGLLLPAAAHAEMTACQLLERTDLEEITSQKFGTAQAQSLESCSGGCVGPNGWRCLYPRADGMGRIFIEIYRPPFWLPGGIDIYREIYSYDPDGHVSDVPDLPGIWYFRADQTNGRGVLAFDDRDSARLTIVIEGEDNDQALSAAKGIAQLVVSRLHAE